MHLTIIDSYVIKGVAILLMLIHHLFANPAGIYADITVLGHPLVETFGGVGKLCVSMFVFISGYGLASQMAERPVAPTAFYRRRFSKLYPSYWLVLILFIPIGVFVFGRSLEDAYGTDILSGFLLDVFGLIFLTGRYGYNPTWWFYSCIIVLYFAFPVFFKMMNKTPLLLILLVGVLDLGIGGCLAVISPYVTSFVLGMFVSKIKPEIADMTPLKRVVLCSGALVCLLWLLMIRILGNVGLRYDFLVCLALVYFLKSANLHSWIVAPLAFLGRHSTNIFLTHTFIYVYFFSDFIYSDPNPVFILLKLLAICIPVSMLLEYMKKAPLLNTFFRSKSLSASK